MLDYWHNQYITRGYVPGGMFSNQDIRYIPIPKNSSSYVGKLLLANGWGVDNYLTTTLSDKKVIVLLRDPVKRWISGMAQYLCSAIVAQGYTADDIIQQWSPLIQSLVFDRVIFDDHTEKQVYFIKTQLPKTCVYFNSSHGVAELLQKYLAEQNINLNIVNVELGDNIQHVKLSAFLKSLLENPILLTRIKEVYAEDYALISSVKFYD